MMYYSSMNYYTTYNVIYYDILNNKILDAIL